MLNLLAGQGETGKQSASRIVLTNASSQMLWLFLQKVTEDAINTYNERIELYPY